MLFNRKKLFVTDMSQNNQNKAKTSLHNISENIKRENSLSKEAKQVLNKLDEESKTRMSKKEK